MEANPSAESLLSVSTWAIWAMLGLCALFYFASSYLFEILAQKHEQPRWMAWVPIANGRLMMRLVGWEKWFWVALGGYALGLGAALLAVLGRRRRRPRRRRPLATSSALARFPAHSYPPASPRPCGPA